MSYDQRKVQFPLIIGAENMNFGEVCAEGRNKILFYLFPVEMLKLT